MVPESSLAILSQAAPFKSLPKDRLRQMASTSVERRFAKGETIFSEGEKAGDVWLLCKGKVQILKYASQGQPLAIESLGPGELFGILCRLNEKKSVYPCTAVAASAVATLRIPDSGFMRCFEEEPTFTHGICSLCVDRLKDFQHLRGLEQESAPVKVAETLLRMSKTHGERIPFTKREIAEFCGIATETVFRALSTFQKKGWIHSRYAAVLIKNPDALASFADRR